MFKINDYFLFSKVKILKDRNEVKKYNKWFLLFIKIFSKIHVDYLQLTVNIIVVLCLYFIFLLFKKYVFFQNLILRIKKSTDLKWCYCIYKKMFLVAK